MANLMPHMTCCKSLYAKAGENVLAALHLTMLCHLYGLQRLCKIPSPAFSLTVKRSYPSFEPDLAASHPFFVVSPILLADYPLQQRTLHSMPGQLWGKMPGWVSCMTFADHIIIWVLLKLEMHTSKQNRLGDTRFEFAMSSYIVSATDVSRSWQDERLRHSLQCSEFDSIGAVNRKEICCTYCVHG